MATDMHVCVIGLGYIGLPTAAMLANAGCRVTGIDVTSSVVETINRGQIHLVEPGLETLVASVVQQGRLKASLQPVSADAYIIAVPTPVDGRHAPDMSYVEQALANIAPTLKSGCVVIIESTSPVGTTEKARQQVAQLRPDLRIASPGQPACDVHIAFCPERVLPGRILIELQENDRIVGGITDACAQRAADVYRQFVRGTISITSASAAEMVKLTENAFRDVNIAFANELSMLCDTLGLNVWEIIQLANRHPRVDILKPGPGVGGHCIAVDPWFIVHSAPKEARIIALARQINDGKRDYVVEKVKEAARTLSRRPVIACLGLAFKPDVDDLRESPAIHIVEALAQDKVGTLMVAEPHVHSLPRELAGHALELVDAEAAVAQADIVVVLVAHSAFRGIPQVKLTGKIVIDPCGLFASSAHA